MEHVRWQEAVAVLKLPLEIVGWRTESSPSLIARLIQFREAATSHMSDHGHIYEQNKQHCGACTGCSQDLKASAAKKATMRLEAREREVGVWTWPISRLYTVANAVDS